MGSIASQITSLSIVYSAVYSGGDQRKHQSSASRAFVRGNHREPVNSPHKWPVTRKMFPSDDVIMIWQVSLQVSCGNSCHYEREIQHVTNVLTMFKKSGELWNDRNLFSNQSYQHPWYWISVSIIIEAAHKLCELKMYYE